MSDACPSLSSFLSAGHSDRFCRQAIGFRIVLIKLLMLHLQHDTPVCRRALCIASALSQRLAYLRAAEQVCPASWCVDASVVQAINKLCMQSANRLLRFDGRVALTNAAKHKTF